MTHVSMAFPWRVVTHNESVMKRHELEKKHFPFPRSGVSAVYIGEWGQVAT